VAWGVVLACPFLNSSPRIHARIMTGTDDCSFDKVANYLHCAIMKAKHISRTVL